MRKGRRDVLAISDAELAQLTSDLDEMHHATLPAMHAAAEEWAQGLRTEAVALGHTSTSRRRFLLGGGAAIGALAFAACSSAGQGRDDPNGLGNPTPTDPPGVPKGALSGDFAIAASAASLENLAVGTYQAALDAATAGKLGNVPPAVATFAATAKAQHADHAAAWNSVLTNAGKRPIAGVDLTVKNGVVDPAFAEVTDVTGLAKLALMLENVAAATYLNHIGTIENNNALKIAASIQPVEMQHAAILNFVLGQYPVPDAFAKTDGFRPTGDEIG